jgi:methionine sulfoxide reductase heme-binding subunit
MTNSIDPGQHLWWLASRSMGVVAMVLVSLSVALGLAMSGRIVRGPGVAARLKTVHEALALSGLMAIVVHGLLLLPDPFLHPGLAGMTIPFALPARRAGVAAGVVAGWLAAIITLSFYVRSWIGTRAWRRLHRWTFAVYLLGLTHTIAAGTDAGAAWLLALLTISALPVVAAGAYRVATLEPSPRAPGKLRAHGGA